MTAGAAGTKTVRAGVILGVSAVVALVVLVALAPLVNDDAALLLDPGPVVRYGLLVATGVRDVAGAVTLGAAILAATVLPRPGAPAHHRVYRDHRGPTDHVGYSNSPDPDHLPAPDVAESHGGAGASGTGADGGAAEQTDHRTSAAVCRAGCGETVTVTAATTTALEKTQQRSRRAGFVASEGYAKCVFIASIVWSVASMAHIVLAFGDISVPDWTDPTIGEQLMHTVTNVPLFQYFASATCFVVAASVFAAVARGPIAMGWVTGLSSVAWFCISLTGHAAGAGNHELAVSGWWLHVLGMGVWLGGVVALVVVGAGWPGSSRSDLAAVCRFSRLALWGAGVVWVSGVASAALRLATLADLGTLYGLVVVAKTVGTALLIVAGWAHRQWVINKWRAATNPTGSMLFGRIVAGEMVVFGAIMALAVILSRTAPPVPDTEVIGDRLTPAEIVTGYVLPPWPSGLQWVTQWRPDILWWGVGVVLSWQYVAAALKLRRRGDAWPWARTVCWVVGMALLVYLTTGAPMVYGSVLFSAHMLQHMLLSMLLPLFLVLGAPMTLLLRAVPPRTDATMGWREWALAVVRSGWVRMFSHPIVAAVNFAGSILVFYYSRLFEYALGTHIGHLLMTVHFVAAGYLFAEVLIGADPGVKRPSFPVRLLLLFATMGFHAFFGVGISASTQLMAATYFSSLGWGIDLLEDQRTGGGIAWGVGEIPTLALALLVAAEWVRSDRRRMRQVDRAAERDHDADLMAYNAMLEGLDDADHPVDDSQTDAAGGAASAGKTASASSTGPSGGE